MLVRMCKILRPIYFIDQTSVCLLDRTLTIGFIAGAERSGATALLDIVDGALLLTKGELHPLFLIELPLCFTFRVAY